MVLLYLGSLLRISFVIYKNIQSAHELWRSYEQVQVKVKFSS